MNILQACHDPRVFGPWFKDPSSWEAWFAFLAALFGLPMTDEQLAIYRKHTGRVDAPEGPQGEAWLVCGRRAGKSFIMALTAVYLATFRQYREFLQPGERATVAVIAADRKQARIVVRYIRAMLTGIPTFKALLERETTEAFDLSGQVTIEVQTASATSTRGYTYAAVICDEIAHWPTDEGAAESDEDILTAIKPGMLTIPNPILLCASSPHAKRGAMWNAYRRHYGKPGGPLVWQAETTAMNPKASRREIAKAYEGDPAAAAAEFGGLFRNDLESFVALETVEACVSTGVRERPPVAGVKYRAFVDPSGGSSDSMTLAIGHLEGEVVVVDAMREAKAPFSPAAVTREFSDLLKAYGVETVTGDRYAGEWPRQEFRRRGIGYALADQPKSALYLGLLPALNTGSVDLVDFPGLVSQIASLERRVAWGGRESIDHAPGAHDDVANVVAGLVRVLAGKGERPAMAIGSWGSGLSFGGILNPLVGRFCSHPRRSTVEDLPPPEWVREPRSAAQRAAAADYLRRRG